MPRHAAPDLGRVLRLFDSEKIYGGSVGQMGVGLKQGCVFLSSLSFVFSRGEKNVSFGIIDDSLQSHDYSPYLPHFAFSLAGAPQVTIAYLTEAVLGAIGTSDLDKREGLRRVIASYAPPSPLVHSLMQNSAAASAQAMYVKGCERLAGHLYSLCTEWAVGARHSFRVVLAGLRQTQGKADDTQQSKVATQEQIAQDMLKTAEEEVLKTYMHVPPHLDFRIGSKRLVFKYWLNRLAGAAEFLIRISKQAPNEYAQGSVFGSKKYHNMFAITDPMIAEFTLPANAPPHSWKVGEKIEATTKEWVVLDGKYKDRAIYYSGVIEDGPHENGTYDVVFDDDGERVKQIPLHLIRPQTYYTLKVIVGFDPVRENDNVSQHTADLHVHSCEVGRRIKTVKDARNCLSLGSTGTDFSQSLTIIVDDRHSYLPLNPSKQDLVFGQWGSDYHEQNFYSWIGGVTHLYWRHHFNQFRDAFDAPKAALSAVVKKQIGLPQAKIGTTSTLARCQFHTFKEKESREEGGFLNDEILWKVMKRIGIGKVKKESVIRPKKDLTRITMVLGKNATHVSPGNLSAEDGFAKKKKKKKKQAKKRKQQVMRSLSSSDNMSDDDSGSDDDSAYQQLQVETKKQRRNLESAKKKLKTTKALSISWKQKYLESESENKKLKKDNAILERKNDRLAQEKGSLERKNVRLAQENGRLKASLVAKVLRMNA